MKDNKWMVYVDCITYNHSKYIKDALDSICMQQTDFPFICGIVDDASVDGEPEIILKYLEDNFICDDTDVFKREENDDYIRIFTRHKTNKNCVFVVFLLKYNHYQIKKSKELYKAAWKGNAKYIAICEGDDYWVDPLKLQKQVDFMETHPQHTLCFCNSIGLFPDGKTITTKRYLTNMEVCPIEDIIKKGGGAMATNSMLYSQEKYIPYSTWAIDCPVGDLPMTLSLAAKGDVGFLSDVMCVHRMAVEGSWTSRMASDIKKRRKHHKDMNKMWHQFDKWTDGKYHKIVVKKIWRNRVRRWKDEWNYIKSIVK